jgi:hypothetical protein
MDDNKLDELLRQNKRVWDDGVTDGITRMVFATEAEARQGALAHRRPHRRGVIIGAVVAGAIALTAGASITAAELGIPPFQSIEAGTQRVATPVPVTYTESNGTPVTCQAFMEFRNLDNASQAQLASDIKKHDWSGVGQAAYDAARIRGGTSDEINSHFTGQIRASMLTEATAVLPQLVEGPSTTKGVIFNGYGMSCSAQNNW